MPTAASSRFVGFKQHNLDIAKLIGKNYAKSERSLLKAEITPFLPSLQKPIFPGILITHLEAKR